MSILKGILNDVMNILDKKAETMSNKAERISNMSDEEILQRSRGEADPDELRERMGEAREKMEDGRYAMEYVKRNYLEDDE